MVWNSFVRRNGVRRGPGRSLAVLFAVAAAVALSASAPAVTVPFTETFATDNALWSIGSSTVFSGATWNAAGGPGGSSYISRLGSGPDGMFSGPTLFRGQDNFNSSADAFVGDWITDGVGLFTVDVFHDHTSALDFTVRLANSFNDPGASSVAFSVPASTWTTLSVPIVDSTSSFQTYGSLGAVPDATSFSTIFSSIGNIQIGLPSGQVGGGLPTVTFGLANPTVAVPEPGTWAVLAGAAAMGLFRLRRCRGRHAA